MVKRGLFILILAASAGVTTAMVANRDAAAAAPVGATAQALDVIMYATRECPYCAKAREYFSSKGVQWEERDIETSPKAQAEWKAQGGVGTPLVLINGQPFQGFDQARLGAELAKYGK
jgi:glutaredoxin